MVADDLHGVVMGGHHETNHPKATRDTHVFIMTTEGQIAPNESCT